MDRINSANTATLNPGNRRAFQDENLVGGIAGTEVNAAYMTSLQEELLALIEDAGLTPDATKSAQILQGMLRRFAGNYTLVTANTTLTPDMAGDIVVDASAGNVTVTLCAAAAAAGQVATVPTVVPLTFRIWRRDNAATRSVTVVPAGSDRLQPGALASLPVGSLEAWLIEGDGAANWQIAALRRSSSRAASVTTAGAFSLPVPAGMVAAEIWLIGGGGGGGGSSTTDATHVSAAPGGNGGARCFGILPVTPGGTLTGTVGAGGPGGAAGGGNGGNGGTTTVTNGTTTLTAPGGHGAPGTATAPPPAAQAPMPATSVASGGLINGGESSGQAAVSGSTTGLNTMGGAGGPGLLGGGGGSCSTGGGAGGAGTEPGAGGGGGSSNINTPGYPGGSGADGGILVRWLAA